MREMSTSDIQQVALSILRDVHDFCVENDIKYTLQGGSLIGAIRHKGFIPWDDDIDVAMPRPDYDRFVAGYKSKQGFKLFCRENDKNVYLSFARVCEMEKTYVSDSFSPWSEYKTGVWIDIFPLDGAEDDLQECKRRVNNMKKVWLLGTMLRHSRATIAIQSGLKNKLKQIGRKFLSLFVSSSIYDKHISMCRKLDWNRQNYYSNFAFLGYGVRERHSKHVLDEVVLVPFEDDKFFIMGGYDEALKEKYGNYMELPPVEKRQCGHSFNKYYWTD